MHIRLGKTTIFQGGAIIFVGSVFAVSTLKKNQIINRRNSCRPCSNRKRGKFDNVAFRNSLFFSCGIDLIYLRYCSTSLFFVLHIIYHAKIVNFFRLISLKTANFYYLTRGLAMLPYLFQVGNVNLIKLFIK
jgi:hypothetical protein